MNEEKVICEKCGAEMHEAPRETQKILIDVFVCPACKNVQDEGSRYVK